MAVAGQPGKDPGYDRTYHPAFELMCSDGHTWEREGYTDHEGKFEGANDDWHVCPDCKGLSQKFLSQEGIVNPFQDRWSVRCRKGHCWHLTGWKKEDGGYRFKEGESTLCGICGGQMTEVLGPAS